MTFKLEDIKTEASEGKKQSINGEYNFYKNKELNEDRTFCFTNCGCDDVCDDYCKKFCETACEKHHRPYTDERGESTGCVGD